MKIAQLFVSFTLWPIFLCAEIKTFDPTTLSTNYVFDMKSFLDTLPRSFKQPAEWSPIGMPLVADVDDWLFMQDYEIRRGLEALARSEKTIIASDIDNLIERANRLLEDLKNGPGVTLLAQKRVELQTIKKKLPSDQLYDDIRRDADDILLQFERLNMTVLKLHLNTTAVAKKLEEFKKLFDASLDISGEEAASSKIKAKANDLLLQLNKLSPPGS